MRAMRTFHSVRYNNSYPNIVISLCTIAATTSIPMRHYCKFARAGVGVFTSCWRDDALPPICKCIFACNQARPSVRLSSYRIEEKIGFSVLAFNSWSIVIIDVSLILVSSARNCGGWGIEMSFSSFQLIASDWIAGLRQTWTKVATKQNQSFVSRID